MHKKVVDIMVEKLLNLLPSQFMFDVTDKFTTFDITTRVLSPLFPLMADYQPERKITIDISNIDVKPLFNSKDQSVDALLTASLNIITINPATGKQ